MNLERKDLQQLQHVLKQSINHLVEYKEIVNAEINNAWNESIPGTELGKKQFKKLNRLKDDKRWAKKQYKTVSELQRKIKLILSSTNV